MSLIPLEKTVYDFQKLLKSSALTGQINVTLMDIIQQLRQEPIYDVDLTIEEVTKALVAPNPDTNCVTGDCSEYVVVNKEKLDQIILLIRNGGKYNVKPELPEKNRPCRP